MGFLDKAGTAGLLSLGGSVFSSVLGGLAQRNANRTNLRIAQMNNDFNERMFDKQIQYNWDMWNANNEYNSAVNQVKRLRSAGLNPAMMMGSGNAGTASSGGSVSPPTATPVNVQPVTGYSTLFDKLSSYLASLEQFRGERINNDQRKAYGMKMMAAALEQMKSQTHGQKLKNSYQTLQNSILLQTRDSIIQTAKNEARNGELESQIRLLEIGQRQVQLAADELRLSWLPTQLLQEYTESCVRINNMRLSGKLTKAQTINMMANTLKTLAERDGIVLDNEYKDANNQTFIRDKDMFGFSMMQKMAFATYRNLTSDTDYKKAQTSLAEYEEEYRRLSEPARLTGDYIRNTLGAVSESLPGINIGTNMDDEYYRDNKGNVKHRRTRHTNRSFRVGR